MKRKNLKTLFVLPLVILSSCNKVVRTENVSVVANYDLATMKVSLNIDGKNITNAKKISKQSKKILNNAIIGDNLEINYLSDDKIDKIIVDEATYISVEVYRSNIPGAQGPQIFDLDNENDTFHLNHNSITFVINEDGTFFLKDELKDEDKVYAVYREEDVKETVSPHKAVEIVALYSYMPRL